MKHRKWMLVSLIVAVFVASFSFTMQAQAALPFDSCWGQVSSAFAQLGYMGEHASQEPLPRDGLHNLAVDLYMAGVIDEPTMAALGNFVASETPGVDVCSP